MKFGVRQIVNVVFRAKDAQMIGNKTFQKGQPVFYMDSAKTSTLQGAATTVYATGGRGNTRLVTWEGERTLTFTVEDALLSPISFAMLSGAGVVRGLENNGEKIHFHQTTAVSVNVTNYSIDLTDALESADIVCSTAPIYVMEIDETGDLTGKVFDKYTVSTGTGSNVPGQGKGLTWAGGSSDTPPTGTVLVDYYVLKDAASAFELQIDAENFAGYYYVEADTLFRRQSDGKDLPANITLPNIKIQSNFTFSMASTGDPSTFTFTMDAMPGYTYFDRKKKVLCAIQVIDEESNVENAALRAGSTLFPHPTGFNISESVHDSVDGTETGEFDD